MSLIIRDVTRRLNVKGLIDLVFHSSKKIHLSEKRWVLEKKILLMSMEKYFFANIFLEIR